MDYQQQADAAFGSPTALTSRRLGSRGSRDMSESQSSNQGGGGGRRSVSLINSAEDAHLFDQMGVATGVIVSPKSINAEEINRDLTSPIDGLIKGANAAAVHLMRSFSPTTVDNKIAEEEEASLWDFARREDTDSRTAGAETAATSQRTPLDLHNNDNSFHVLANLLVEFLQTKLTQDGRTIVLRPEDRVRMERVLPESIRLDFIDAVRYRLEHANYPPKNPLDFLTLQCQELGLDREGRLNPILVAANLNDEMTFIPIMSALTAISFDKESSMSSKDMNQYLAMNALSNKSDDVSDTEIRQLIEADSQMEFEARATPYETMTMDPKSPASAISPRSQDTIKSRASTGTQSVGQRSSQSQGTSLSRVGASMSAVDASAFPAYRGPDRRRIQPVPEDGSEESPELVDMPEQHSSEDYEKVDNYLEQQDTFNQGFEVPNKFEHVDRIEAQSEEHIENPSSYTDDAVPVVDAEQEYFDQDPDQTVISTEFQDGAAAKSTEVADDFEYVEEVGGHTEEAVEEVIQEMEQAGYTVETEAVLSDEEMLRYQEEAEAQKRELEDSPVVVEESDNTQEEYQVVDEEVPQEGMEEEGVDYNEEEIVFEGDPQDAVEEDAESEVVVNSHGSDSEVIAGSVSLDSPEHESEEGVETSQGEQVADEKPLSEETRESVEEQIEQTIYINSNDRSRRGADPPEEKGGYIDTSDDSYEGRPSSSDGGDSGKAGAGSSGDETFKYEEEGLQKEDDEQESAEKNTPESPETVQTEKSADKTDAAEAADAQGSSETHPESAQKNEADKPTTVATAKRNSNAQIDTVVSDGSALDLVKTQDQSQASQIGTIPGTMAGPQVGIVFSHDQPAANEACGPQVCADGGIDKNQSFSSDSRSMGVLDAACAVCSLGTLNQQPVVDQSTIDKVNAQAKYSALGNLVDAQSPGPSFGANQSNLSIPLSVQHQQAIAAQNTSASQGSSAVRQDQKSVASVTTPQSVLTRSSLPSAQEAMAQTKRVLDGHFQTQVRTVDQFQSSNVLEGSTSLGAVQNVPSVGTTGQATAPARLAGRQSDKKAPGLFDRMGALEWAIVGQKEKPSTAPDQNSVLTETGTVATPQAQSDARSVGSVQQNTSLLSGYRSLPALPEKLTVEPETKSLSLTSRSYAQASTVAPSESHTISTKAPTISVASPAPSSTATTPGLTPVAAASTATSEAPETRAPARQGLFTVNPFAAIANVANPFAVGGFGGSTQSDAADTDSKSSKQRRDVELRTPDSNDYTMMSEVSGFTGLKVRADNEPLLEEPEALARQQLLAELREAKNLLEQSHTPETLKFWKNHVTDLQARIRALNGEEAPVTPGSSITPAEILESNRRLVTEIQQREQYVQTKMEPIFPKVEVPAFPSQQDQPSASEYAPPTLPGGSAADKTAPSSTYPPAFSVASPSDEVEDQRADNPPMVDVVAPADLPGGYHFEAEIEGKRFLATVPEGGVQQGETFTCPMRELNSVAIDIPVGYWKDDLSNICAYGCCHSVFWNSFFCPLVALGQVQTRVGLDFLGRPNEATKYTNRFMMLLVIVAWVGLNVGLYAGYNWKWSRGLDLSMADLVACGLVNVTFVGFVIFVTQSTRSSLREKFMIREQRCYDLEDIFCSSLCMPCTVGQMSRHTANYDDYEAVCCSKTGLPDGVRVNQRPKETGSPYVV